MDTMISCPGNRRNIAALVRAPFDRRFIPKRFYDDRRGIVFCFVAQPSEDRILEKRYKENLIFINFRSEVSFCLLQNTIRLNRIFLKGPRSLVLALSWFTGTMPHDIKWMIAGHRHYALHPPDWLQNPRISFVIRFFFFCFQAQRNFP